MRVLSISPQMRRAEVVLTVPRDGAPRSTPDIEPGKLVSRGHCRNQIMCMTTQGSTAVPSAWPTPGTFNPKCIFAPRSQESVRCLEPELQAVSDKDQLHVITWASRAK